MPLPALAHRMRQGGCPHRAGRPKTTGVSEIHWLKLNHSFSHQSLACLDSFLKEPPAGLEMGLVW